MTARAVDLVSVVMAVGGVDFEPAFDGVEAALGVPAGAGPGIVRQVFEDGGGAFAGGAERQ